MRFRLHNYGYIKMPWEILGLDSLVFLSHMARNVEIYHCCATKSLKSHKNLHKEFHDITTEGHVYNVPFLHYLLSFVYLILMFSHFD